MGSGKTLIAKILSQKTGLELFDLDKEISKRNNTTIPQIFEKKGEIFFRKREREVLEELLASKDNCILSLGGGTPAYYNNMEVINQYSISIFLQTPINILAERLIRQKQKRPIIAKIPDDEISEFVAKHLFERNPYYSKARYTINTAHKNPEDIVGEILEKVF